MIGGQLGYNSSNSRSQMPIEMYESDGLVFSVSAGKAIKENLFLGLELGTGLTKSEQHAGYKSRNAYHAGGIFVRKYFDIGKRFFIFTQGNSGVGFFDNESTSTTDFTENEGYNVFINFTPGLSYALNRRLQLETGFQSIISAGYSRGKARRSTGAELRQENFNVSTNLNNLASLSIGLRLLFSK